MQGVDLITAYRSYFNHDYNQLKRDVSSLEQLILNNCSDVVIDRLKASFDIGQVVIEGWREHLSLSQITFQEVEVRQAITELRGLLEGLKDRKQANLLESQGSESEKQIIQSKWQEIINIASSTNSAIELAITDINKYKETLATVDVSALRGEIVSINRSIQRHASAPVELIAQLSTAKQEEKVAKIDKDAKKRILNEIMEATLTTYRNSINELLRSFGAQFEIPTIDFNYQGGLSTDYALEMRGGNIALNGGTHDFRTSLSEGDKRTLAFAFFIASIEANSDLSRKIVIIDDPMCSLDLNRKHQTRIVLKRIHDYCDQLIVLAHDAHFLRQLRNDIIRTTGVNPNDSKCLKLKAVANDYSDIDSLDIDMECETAYFKCHRILEEFLNGDSTNTMEVARSIRAMLEGYLHRRFPGKISIGLLFGQIITLINASIAPNPFLHAQDITEELYEIKTYVGQFHHDTNAAADGVIIIESELRTFVNRALLVIHSGIHNR